MIELDLVVNKVPQNPNTPQNLPPDPVPDVLTADDLTTVVEQVRETLHLRNGDYVVSHIEYEQIVNDDEIGIRAKQIILDYVWPS